MRAVRKTLAERRGDLQRAALILATAVAAGDTLHEIAHSLRLPLAHHFFHVVFSAGAIVVFGAYVAYNVYRRGWPGFSWRLR